MKGSVRSLKTGLLCEQVANQGSNEHIGGGQEKLLTLTFLSLSQIRYELILLFSITFAIPQT